jgi:hypothetical protein
VATYLYGLILARNAGVVPSDVRGVQDAPVRVVDCGRVGALASSAVREARHPTLDDVRAHDRVLQAVVDRGPTVAAVRFGQWFESDAEMRTHVASLDALGDLLDARDGCVEMRLLLPQSAELSAMGHAPARKEGSGPGRAYLESLRAHYPIAGVALDGMLGAGSLVLEERVDAVENPPGAVFAHLIRRSDVDAYRAAVRKQPALAKATLVGPLALHSFADATS